MWSEIKRWGTHDARPSGDPTSLKACNPESTHTPCLTKGTPFGSVLSSSLIVPLFNSAPSTASTSTESQQTQKKTFEKLRAVIIRQTSNELLDSHKEFCEGWVFHIHTSAGRDSSASAEFCATVNRTENR
jgi:hypothetical protein